MADATTSGVLTDAIQARLRADTTVGTLVSGIWLNEADPNFPPVATDSAATAVQPIGYIVIKQISDIADATMDGDSGLSQSRVQIECIGSNFDTARLISLAVKKSLHGQRFTAAGRLVSPCLKVGGLHAPAYSPGAVTNRSFIFIDDYEAWWS